MTDVRAPGRGRTVRWALLAALTPMAASGCLLAPSHPVPPYFGARADGDTIVVKIPVCPTDEIRRVEVYDVDDDEHDAPRVVWWASGPTSPSVRAGVVTLWTGAGFARHSPRPAGSSVPPHIGVSYQDPAGDGRDDVFTVRTLGKAKLGAGEYWTRDGARTEAQIDGQLGCGAQRKSATTPAG
ncbi:hypothetical protein ACFY30_13785 [Streptomyces sp. NPDC000345]|uniref:hypothetical protein n=1 Tax=Streptomyces sp. NPDC000345 TaxID=3364537 RepID=UPI003689539A